MQPRKGLGLGLRNEFGEAQFTVFQFATHYHSKNDETPCMFRWGIEIGVFGLLVAVGIFEK